LQFSKIQSKYCKRCRSLGHLPTFYMIHVAHINLRRHNPITSRVKFKMLIYMLELMSCPVIHLMKIPDKIISKLRKV